MNKAACVVTFIFLVVLGSCGKQSTLSYKVTNIASDSVDVICMLPNRDTLADTFKIGYNQQVTIAINEEGSEHVSMYKEKGDTLRGFSKISVYRNHTQPSKTDFRKTSLWTYDEKGKNRADYIVTISDKDF